MLDVSKIKENKEAEIQGKWIDAASFDEQYEGVKFKIARAGGTNKKYIRAHDSLSRELSRKDQQKQAGGLLSLEKSIELNQKVFAKSVIIDWGGVGNKGEVLPCTEQNVLALFELLPDLFVWISEKAQDENEFYTDELKEAGND